MHIPSRTWISKARSYGPFLFNVFFWGGWWLCFCGYWNCPPLFKVSFHKHCRVNPISPICKPSTIPWSIFHLLIYAQYDNSMIWIQHRWGIYQDSGIGHILARNTGITHFSIRRFIFHILGLGIAVFLCSGIQYVKFFLSKGFLKHILILYENVYMYVIDVLCMYYVNLMSNKF